MRNPNMIDARCWFHVGLWDTSSCLQLMYTEIYMIGILRYMSTPSAEYDWNWDISLYVSRIQYACKVHYLSALRGHFSLHISQHWLVPDPKEMSGSEERQEEVNTRPLDKIQQRHKTVVHTLKWKVWGWGGGGWGGSRGEVVAGCTIYSCWRTCLI